MVAVLPALATGALTSLGGFGASKLLGGLFGGGGDDRSGGGGKFDFESILPKSYGPADDFLEDYFGNMSGFSTTKPYGPRDFDNFEKYVNKGIVDKYDVLNKYGSMGVDPSSQDYKDILFDKITKNQGLNIAGLVGKQMGAFSGIAPDDAKVRELYKLGKRTGKVGSGAEFSNFVAQSLAMDPNYRTPSGQEYLAGMRYGPLVNVGGTMMFKATPETRKRMARQEEGAQQFADFLGGAA